MSEPVALEPYDPARLEELLALWRESFERALGLVDPHPMEDQRRYFLQEVLPASTVVMALCAGRLVGFAAATPEAVGQLYVRVGWQGRGIGTHLLGWAKARSSGKLRLFAFERNAPARRFYERHGFVEVARGFEPFWGLPDVTYEWVRPA